ncbi:MAG: hypothetical protein F6J95_020865 [Leptolyngbya sp. SIO1E4]|nr:hypothetical protein [Leptolyngbya sp. SIO1E4]
MSLGSANLDPRSFFHNDEFNLCTNAQHLIQSVEEFFQRGFDYSRLIQPPAWQKRPWQERVVGRIGNFFIGSFED